MHIPLEQRENAPAEWAPRVSIDHELSTPPWFAIIFTKGNNSYDLFAFLHNAASQKGIHSQRKEFARWKQIPLLKSWPLVRMKTS